jgi:hypothetical protein
MTTTTTTTTTTNTTNSKHDTQELDTNISHDKDNDSFVKDGCELLILEEWIRLETDRHLRAAWQAQRRLMQSCHGNSEDDKFLADPYNNNPL